MFPDYKELVLRSYRKKRDASELSSALQYHSPAQLRDACLAACTERFLKSDEKTLSDFFGKCNSPADYAETIRNFDINKFRQLNKFLNNHKMDTNEKNIELLAWLIDFEDRPFKLSKKYSLEETPVLEKEKTELPEGDIKPVETKKAELLTEDIGNEKDDITTSLASTPGTNNSEITTNSPALIATPPKPLTPPTTPAPLRKTRKRYAIMISILATGMLLAGTGIYWRLHNNINYKTPMLTGNEKCMFWAGDHYQPISCNEKIDGTLVIALDSTKITHFKKITRPDTITYNAKGFVWYVKPKKDSDPEYYTSEGFHPVSYQLRLKPITNYIIDKYITPLRNN
ncbi:hypothetical protein SAMN05421788_102306 [Filimonas lacunae]|uniref:Uncharacterized protein n=1 Tax=Filimonas lacunae TaxID=477680 RepID=A0A173MHH1_9BACT|nr:hypothetical protein [Filimonas lacunae]BAV07062.1 hypothetical protein FLA_3082 [Filimonas lacunae]SIS95507.1 hypothetical protein SAMN05421788_102306 [Filimonas lacunae]